MLECNCSPKDVQETHLVVDAVVDSNQDLLHSHYLYVFPSGLDFSYVPTILTIFLAFFSE